MYNDVDKIDDKHFEPEAEPENNELNEPEAEPEHDYQKYRNMSTLNLLNIMTKHFTTTVY